VADEQVVLGTCEKLAPPGRLTAALPNNWRSTRVLVPAQSLIRGGRRGRRCHGKFDVGAAAGMLVANGESDRVFPPRRRLMPPARLRGVQDAMGAASGG